MCTGMVTLPMTFLSNTPLDCTIHHSLWPAPNSTSRIPHHTRYVQSYAKKYCSETHLSPFLLYLPFTLLLAPMALTACEKVFIRYVGQVNMSLVTSIYYALQPLQHRKETGAVLLPPGEGELGQGGCEHPGARKS